jgi:hypothetical protein
MAIGEAFQAVLFNSVGGIVRLLQDPKSASSSLEDTWIYLRVSHSKRPITWPPT